MRIAVATNDGQTITGHVGRCFAFAIYDINGGTIEKVEIRENTFTHHRMTGRQNHEHHHGEGQHHGHESLIEGLKDCTVLLFSGGGWRLIEDLEKNNIKPFLTEEADIETAVQKFAKGELVENKDLTCNRH